MIHIRMPEEIYQTKGDIKNGTFSGRWHFSFGEYRDPENVYFGTLRVFNDDTLSPGAVWPLHPHREIEVVTYCVEGEFRHEDEHGKGGILTKGGVQHTTVGRGMHHAEINNRQDIPMRFIQMWFFPSEPGHDPSVQQKIVERSERTNQLFPLVSNEHEGALPILSFAQVYSCFLEPEKMVRHRIGRQHGVYLYVLEGGAVRVNGHHLPPLAAARIYEEFDLNIKADAETELLLVDVLLI